MPILGAALGDAGGPIETRIFVGPKAINVLKSVHAADPRITLDRTSSSASGPHRQVSLSVAAGHPRPHHARWSGSWGWAIIVLTVFINLLILPFRVKTMHSALKMQRIQPQMDAIKERYKKYKVTDPKRSEMNAEIMQLQKDNGVNMFGGCIPQLITMPLMIAFFYMLPGWWSCVWRTGTAAQPAGRGPVSHPAHLHGAVAVPVQFYTPRRGSIRSSRR